MGYEQWWRVLESLVTEFRKKQVAVPTEVMTSLKSAKTLITVYHADSSYVESIPAIEGYLLDVESSLINMAREKLGQATAEQWMEKLEEARRERPNVETVAPRFVPGLPKDQHWVRILPSDTVLKEDVERLVEELGLSHRMQEDGYILVYGSREGVRNFVKKMAEKCRQTRKT